MRLDDLKGVASLVQNEDDEGQESFALQNEENLKGLAGDALIRQQELNDVYEKVKEELESYNQTLDSICYNELKYMPNQLCTIKGLQQVF